MKIDILDDYIRTPEWFRGLSDIYRSTEVLPEPPPGGYWASWAQVVEEERRPRGSRVPLPPKSELDKEGGRRPPFLSPSLSFPLLSYSNMEGGSPTPGGTRTPHGTHQGWPAPSPSSTPLYTGREAPLETQQLIPWIS